MPGSDGKKYVPNGVFLICDKGAAPSTLQVTPRQVYLYDELWANELDKLPMVNIKPFGACACVMGNPCVPAPIMWMDVFTGDFIMGYARPLLEDSYLMCGLGGRITIQFTRAGAMGALSSGISRADVANAIDTVSEGLKEVSLGLFIGGALVGIGAVALGVVAAPALAAVGSAMAIGAGVGAVLGGVAGGIQSGTWEGALNGALMGAAMGAIGGAVCAIPGGAALLAPSMMAFEASVALDGVALAIDPNERRARNFLSGLVVVGGGKLSGRLIRRVSSGRYSGGKGSISNIGEQIGEFSRRPFSPERSGGPIESLEWRNAEITPEGIDTVKRHTSRFGNDAQNELMIERLEKIQNGEIEATDFDKRFYTHEIREYQRYKNLGVEDGVDPGYEVWNDAHTATLEDFKIHEREQPLYHPETEQ